MYASSSQIEKPRPQSKKDNPCSGFHLNQFFLEKSKVGKLDISFICVGNCTNLSLPFYRRMLVPVSHIRYSIAMFITN